MVTLPRTSSPGRAGLVWLILLAIGLAACAGPAAIPPLATQPPAPVTVRVGQIGGLAEAGQFLAMARGYFAQEGIAIQTEQLADAYAALSTGHLDVAGASLGAGLFNAAARDVGVKVAGPQARHEPGSSAVFIVVRKELIEQGSVRTYGDLRGRRIALNARGSAAEYQVAKALEAGGLTPQDAEVVQIPFEHMGTSLANGAVDAGILLEPLATAAEQKGVGVKWKGVGDVIPGVQQTVVLYSPHFVAKGDLPGRWMTAYLRGVRDYNDAFFKSVRREETVRTLIEFLPVKDPALYDRMGYAVVDPNGIVNLASLEDQMRYHLKAGHLTRPVDLSAMVDTSFAEAAVARLGEYR